MNLKYMEQVSAVKDTGRRGAPLMGCDCVQCFGYCDVDADQYMRELAESREQRARAGRSAEKPI